MKRPAKYITPDPTPGSTRLKRIFAWRRTEIDGMVVWLEYFEVLEGFITFEYKVLVDGEMKMFKVSRWTELSKRIM
jgi:hypothetical protein